MSSTRIGFIINIFRVVGLTLAVGVSTVSSGQTADKNSVGVTGKSAPAGTMMAPVTPGKKPKGSANEVDGVKIGSMAMSASDCSAKGGTIKNGPAVLCKSEQYCSIKNGAGDIVAAECIDAKK